MTKRISVVIATFNRGSSLVDLLLDLGNQTLPVEHFEVVIVDDGSTEPVETTIQKMSLPFDHILRRQTNSGAAAARDNGIRQAIGEIVVIIDDDMRLQSDFLQQHLSAHEAGATVVLGNICPAKNLQAMPIFERFHAHQLERFVQGVRQGTLLVRGVHLCTGNVSFRRSDYLQVGGFDKTLARSEDRELGVRLEMAGGKLIFCESAKSVHESDHTSAAIWMRRAYQYGVFDRRISTKHPSIETADPWRFFFLVSPLSRALIMVPILAPHVGARLAKVTMLTSTAADRLGLQKAAVFGTTLTYGLEYFRGVRADAGSLRNALRELRAYLPKRASANKASTKKRSPRLQALRRFRDAVRSDYDMMQHYRAKYHGDTVSLRHLPVNLLRKIGFQQLFAVRIMQMWRDGGVPLAPQVVSRLIRHLYSSEIHWDAKISAGVCLVHGNGLVISHAATVSAGCILFQNVTLGEGVDPQTREVGAPTLGRNVHVGPGATLVGPIHVGDGSKIMAGVVLAHSVAENSLVRSAAVEVVERGQKKS